jgi:hypothetical protein
MWMPWETYQDFIADPNCCIYDRNKLKLSHPYYSQVQLQMYVHDVSNCDKNLFL